MKKNARPTGVIVIELALAAVILLFIGGALWYANQPARKANQANQAATPTPQPSPTTPPVSQITTAGDVNKSIKELDGESTTALDDDLKSIDSSLNSL